MPFTVENRASVDRQGRIAATANRSFAFASGTRSMVDAITADGNGLLDFLGSRGQYAAHLEAEVAEGALHLRSTRMSIRVLRWWVNCPRAIAPRVLLEERFDEESQLQHVSVILEAPLIGRLYEYAGSFSYEIQRENGDHD